MYFETREAIQKLINKLAAALENDESTFGNEIKQFYINQQSKATTIPQKYKLYKKVQSACEIFSQIPYKHNDLKLFEKELKSVLNSRKIKGVNVDSLVKHIFALNEFMTMKVFNLPTDFEIGKPLKQAMHELNELNEKYKETILDF